MRIFRDRDDIFLIIAMVLVFAIFLTVVGMQAASTDAQAAAIIRQVKILMVLLVVDLSVAAWRIVTRRRKKKQEGA